VKPITSTVSLVVDDPDFMLFQGDALCALQLLPGESVDCVVTSPPYFALRDYGVEGQLGLEDTPDEYIANLREVFDEVHRVLKPTGTMWLVIGDSYAGGGNYRGITSEETLTAKQRSNGGARGVSQALGVKNHDRKNKELCGMPWRLAFALQADGWYLRCDVIWAKPNPMPESITDRPTKSHEYVFMLTKSKSYYFNQDGVREEHSGLAAGNTHSKPNPASEIGGGDTRHGIPWKPGVSPQEETLDGSQGERRGPDGRLATGVKAGSSSIQHRDGERWPNDRGRNIRSVWTIPTQPYPDSHFATYPEKLVATCLKASCPEDGTVLDPFIGSGTTALVARKMGLRTIGIELNPEYAQMCSQRLHQQSLFA